MADAARQQAAQAGLAALVLQDMEGVYPHIDVANLAASQQRLTLLVLALADKYGRISGALSGQFYRQARIAAGLGPYAARVAAPPGQAQVAKVVGWATHDKAGHVLPFEQVRGRLEGATTKLVQDVGRDTIVGSVQADPKARAWARVPEAGCCAFCALLATRGAVYSEDTAGFKSHDHCRCHAEPVFTAYEPSAQVRQWQADYTKATRGVRGSRNQRVAWRQAFEGRTTT